MVSKQQDNQLPLPGLLLNLINAERWKQPSDEEILQVIPFLREPVDFLLGVEAIRFESQGNLADNPQSSAFFREYRGSQDDERDLPWLDVDKAVFIAVNRESGADLGIALDYRTSIEDPRVVASDWWIDEHQCNWRQVDERFSDFALKLWL